MWRLAWRLLWQELRNGELRLLAASIVIAVAAVTAVGVLTDRVQRGLLGEASRLLGADLLLVADQPIPEDWARQAASLGLRTAQVLSFPSMVQGPQGARLSEIKAVSAGYPLLGQLSVLNTEGRPEVRPPPGGGRVWLEPRLAEALGVAAGASVRLGQASLQVAGLLADEPDRGLNVFGFAPRLLMSVEDLAGSGLLQPGARLTYRLALAGPASALEDFRFWVAPHLGRGQRLEDVRNARPELRGALERAEHFLGLAAVISVVLAAVALAMTTRRYVQRHWDACAVLRCLGVTQGMLLRLYVGQFSALAVLAGGLGVALGVLLHTLLLLPLVGVLPGFSGTDLPPVGWHPLGRGLSVALVLLLGFALPPMMGLRRVSALRVLRRDWGGRGGAAVWRDPWPWLVRGLGWSGLLLIVVQAAGAVRLGGLVVVGGALAGLVLALVARAGQALLVVLLHRGGAVLGPQAGFGWRQAALRLQRSGWSASLQIVALALGMTALLLLSVTRQDLFEAWQRALPADAPNRFVINIQPDQVPGVQAALAEAGLSGEIVPMVRARLLRINTRPVDAGAFPDDERAQRLVEREFNLSWRSTLPVGNRVSAGRWLSQDATAQEASVEAGLARTLGIEVGDQLVFRVDGQERSVQVVGLRKLEWDSMRVNFFVLTPPGVLQGASATYITSVYLPPAGADRFNGLLARYPNLTVIDVAAVLAQLQGLLGRVASVMQVVFVFALVAGALVLLAAMQVAMDARRYELAVLRALGASRQQLRQALLIEQAAIGGLAGLLAGLLANVLTPWLAAQAFSLEVTPHAWVLPGTVAAGAGCALLLGSWGIRRLLASPPMLALRAGD